MQVEREMFADNRGSVKKSLTNIAGHFIIVMIFSDAVILHPISMIIKVPRFRGRRSFVCLIR